MDYNSDGHEWENVLRRIRATLDAAEGKGEGATSDTTETLRELDAHYERVLAGIVERCK